MKRILITGLNGIIGWNLYLKAKDRYEVYGTYRKDHFSFSENNIKKIDLNSEEEVAALVGDIDPEILIHCWAMCDLDLCEEFPEMAERVNVEGTKHFIRACRPLKNLKKLLFMSTDHVFGGERGFYRESDEAVPKHVYGRTKRAAEQLVAKSMLPYLIIRPGLILGASAQGNKGPRDFLFSRIRAGKPTHYFTDEWRSPIDAGVFAEKVLEAGTGPMEGILHIAGKTPRNRFEIATELARENNLPTEFIFPRLRREDKWAHIRPFNLSLASEVL